MALFSKSTLGAVAAAIAAAAVLTTVSIPANAGYKRAIKSTKSHGLAAKKYLALNCQASSGDVVAQPLVKNTTGKILPIGTKIQWRAKMADRSIKVGTYTLAQPFYAGQSRRIPATLHWRFTCKASVYA